MSINLTLVQLSEGLAEMITSDPNLLLEISTDPSRDEKMREYGFEIQRKLTEDERPDEYLELGKSWHLLNHLLAHGNWHARLKSRFGLAWPKEFLVSGGYSLGEGSGYGPDRLLSPQDAGIIDSFLSGINITDLLEDLTLDSIQRADIYSYSSGNTSIEEIHNIVRVQIDALQGFMRRSSTSGSSVLIYYR